MKKARNTKTINLKLPVNYITECKAWIVIGNTTIEKSIKIINKKFNMLINNLRCLPTCHNNRMRWMFCANSWMLHAYLHHSWTCLVVTSFQSAVGETCLDVTWFTYKHLSEANECENVARCCKVFASFTTYRSYLYLIGNHMLLWNSKLGVCNWVSLTKFLYYSVFCNDAPQQKVVSSEWVFYWL